VHRLIAYYWQVGTLNYPVICEVFAFVYLVPQYLAPTLVLGFTVERFIAICYPYQVRRAPVFPPKISRPLLRRGSVAEWLACWMQAQKGLGSIRSRDAVG